MSACIIREATLADYSGVLAIGEMYNGLDYIPDMYDLFIKDPDYHCFVCLVDEEIIGFLASFLIDGGTAFDLRAGRVKETHRGRGYYKALREHIYTFYSKMGTVKYEKVVVQRKVADTLVYPNSGFEFIVVQKLYNFDIPSEVGLDVTSELQPLSQSDLETILSRPRLTSCLFPDNIIFVNRIPFSTETTNLRHLFDKRTVIYGTKSIEGDYTLISIGCHFNVPLGFRYWIEVFGTKTDDFKKHIVAHVAHIRTLSCENVILGIAVSDLFPEDRLQEIVELGGRKGQILLEKECTFKRQL